MQYLVKIKADLFYIDAEGYKKVLETKVDETVQVEQFQTAMVYQNTFPEVPDQKQLEAIMVMMRGIFETKKNNTVRVTNIVFDEIEDVKEVEDFREVTVMNNVNPTAGGSAGLVS